ncbi:hypothetical protein ACFW0H_06695 [Pseudomonas sp. CR3202]|uniref:hypothetical protein n=1 Tax=Pseudomonas sp. CR3202 TaxID=3351532 RepID=UPI003BEF94FE
MNFDAFMTDTITVRKKNGQTFEGLKAAVQPGKIFLDRSDILVEPSDLIERRMSNGGIETFDVIDPGFQEAFQGFPAGYQMTVRKLGLPEAKQRIQSITYNITGNNARVNNNSVDNSNNSVTISSDHKDYLEVLRQIVNSLDNFEQKKGAHEIIDCVEQQLSSTNPSKAVVSTLLNALPHVASISTIVSAIVGTL